MENLQSIFETREVKFGDNTDSNDFNNMNKEIGFDLYSAFENITYNRNLINENIDIMQLNNHFLNQKINHIEQSLKELGEGLEYIDFHNSDSISYGDNLPVYEILDEEKALVSNMYNMACLNAIYQKPKTFLTDIHNEEYFIPDDLEVTIEEDLGESAEVIDSGFNKAFDQNLMTAWTRKIIYPEGKNIESVTSTMNIRLPQSIVSSMTTNTLYINPYPERNLDILDILYKPMNGSDYISFIDRGVFTPQNNAKSIALVFNEIQPTDIKIIFRQRNPIVVDNGNKRMFVIGAQNISLYNNHFSEEGYLYVHFKPSNAVSKITDITPKLENIKNDKAIDFTVYGVNNNIDSFVEVNLDENISVNHNRDFWIKISLKKVENVASPVLKGLVIKYQNL